MLDCEPLLSDCEHLMDDYDLLEDFDDMTLVPRKLSPPPFDFFVERRKALEKVDTTELSVLVEKHFARPPLASVFLHLAPNKILLLCRFPGMSWKRCQENNNKWIMDELPNPPTPPQSSLKGPLFLECGDVFFPMSHEHLIDDFIFTLLFFTKRGQIYKFDEKGEAIYFYGYQEQKGTVRINLVSLNVKVPDAGLESESLAMFEKSQKIRSLPSPPSFVLFPINSEVRIPDS